MARETELAVQSISPPVPVQQNSLSATGARSFKTRTLLLVLLVVFFNAAGNLSLAWGMKHVTESVGINPLNYLHAMLHPAVAGGISLLIFWLLTRMALLSWADLSFVLPLTSLGYVLAAVLGKVFLHEAVTLGHWIGTILIFAGTFLVGSTPSKTNEKARAES